MRNSYLLEREYLEPDQISGELPAFQETGFSQAWTAGARADEVSRSTQVCEVLDNFDFDRDQLKPAHQGQLAALASKIIQGQASAQPVRSIHIIGHTDPVGSAQYNKTLGQRRAAQVHDALQMEMERIRRGSTGRITFSVSSRGESQPISRDHARNRRVEICLQPSLSPAPQPAPPAPPPPPLPQNLQSLRTNMIQIAIAEWERWDRGNRKESEASMQPILRKYWEEGVRMTYPGPGRAWSAVFISWVVKQAGAGSAFHYAAAHTRYVAAAKRNRLQNNSNPFKAYRANEIKPQPGDIVCFERKNDAGQWSGVHYDNVDDGKYRASHCDIVTEAGPDGLMKIGGNVSNSVSKKRVPVGPDGYINDSHYYAIIRLTAPGSSPTPRPPSPPPPTPVIPQGAPPLLGTETPPAGTTLYVQIDLKAKDSPTGKAVPPSTGIFIPQNFNPRGPLEIILYLHGWKSDARTTARDYWNKAMHAHRAFREGLNQSKRNSILVLPTLGTRSAASDHGIFRQVGGLDFFISQVMAGLAAYGPFRGQPRPPQLASLILAAHSGGGAAMWRLISGRDRAAALIREGWAFDSTYDRASADPFAQWVRSDPKRRLFVYYVPGTRTEAVAKQLQSMRLSNVFVQPARASHDHVPITYWQERLKQTAGGGNAPGPRPAQNATPHCSPPSNLTQAERTALSVTTNFETGVPFGCAVSKVDGISMGMLQWNLKAGTLQTMLKQFEQSGGNLQNFFGDQAGAVRSLIIMPREAAVQQATTQKLATLWRQSLLRLCSDPLYCGLQARDIKQRMASAQSAARTLGLQTIRGLSMMFDINVGDGLGRRKLTDFKTRLASLSSARGRNLSEREKLIEIADRAATYAGRWADERRARRRVIANGQGVYRRSNWNLDRIFPGLDQPIN